MENLSHLSKGWPSYGASMAGGNMLDNKEGGPQGKLSGTASEQTDQPTMYERDATPDLEVPGTEDYTNDVKPSRAAKAAAVWKTV